MCRQPWGDTTSEVVEKLKSGLVEVSEEGYFNVGEVLGLSEERGEFIDSW